MNASNKEASTGPLAGIRVLDLTTVIMGPYATHILADLGADVIKIEGPDGDSFRQYGPSRSPGMGGSILNLHRNKRSVVLDLKDALGRKALDRLIETSDVLIHNLRPKPAKRLGLSWSQIETSNPRLILCAARGFGSDGPYADKAAYDDIIQAGCGLSSLFETALDRPHYVPSAVCDKLTGQTIAYAVMAALLHRERGGSGQEIEVPMLEASVEFLLAEHIGPGGFEPSLGPMGFVRQLSAKRKPYQTSDGWVCILPYSDRNWLDFFVFIGAPELLTDERFTAIEARVRNVDPLYSILESEAKKRTTAEWVEFSDRVGIPCMPILRLEELESDPHLKAVGLIKQEIHPSEGKYRSVRSPVVFSKTPCDLRRYAPRVGEHTTEVFASLGMPDADIALLATGQ